MPVEEIEKLTKEFLDALVEKDIFKFNTELWKNHQENYARSAVRMNIFAKTFQKLEPMIEKSELTDAEQSIFVSQILVWIIASALELAKILLMTIVIPDVLRTNSEKIMYGRLIEDICIGLKFDRVRTKSFLNNFMVDLRNAIFHNKYDITKDRVTYQNYENKMISLTHEQLVEKTNDADAIFRSIKKFADEKTEELNITEKNLKKREEELNKELYELERKSKGLL